MPLLLLGSTITLVPPRDEEERLAAEVLSDDGPAWLGRLLSELVLVPAVKRSPSSTSISDCDTSPWLLLPLLESRESCELDGSTEDSRCGDDACS